MIKRIFDIIATIVALVIASPVMAVIAVLIALTMPDGPILFRQVRIGQHGKPFVIVKFRTMRAASSGATITASNDSRITPLGSFLRKYKLDELPELWNVLRGDMSLVGPRPDVPGYADLLEGEDRQILQLKPGLTGPATLKYRNEEALLAQQHDPIRYNDEVIWPDKVKINLIYYYNHSLLGDVKILFSTIL
jgi:lipopolysaccharide/colanic/teichoic acid biosynthesis glycosyltransferase